MCINVSVNVSKISVVYIIRIYIACSSKYMSLFVYSLRIKKCFIKSYKIHESIEENTITSMSNYINKAVLKVIFKYIDFLMNDNYDNNFDKKDTIYTK